MDSSDIKYTLDGSPSQANSVWPIDGNGHFTQDVDSSTPTGTYVFTHIRESGTSTWVEIPPVQLEVTSGSASGLKLYIGPQVVRRGDAYGIQMYNGANSQIDVQYSYNGGPTQTVLGLWTTDQYGGVVQPTSGATALGSYVFLRAKKSTDSSWTNIPDVHVTVMD